jgi:hypothetical protein
MGGLLKGLILVASSEVGNPASNLPFFPSLPLKGLLSCGGGNEKRTIKGTSPTLQGVTHKELP